MRGRIRQRHRAMSLSSFAGSYGAGEVDFDPIGKARIAAAASKQVARAAVLSSLSDYRKAEDLTLMWYAPTTAYTAYWKCAYWLAIAARLTSSSGLAASAAAALAKGNMAASPIGLAVSRSADLSGILNDAASKIASAISSNNSALANAGLKAAAKALSVQTTMIVAAQQRAYEQSSPGIVADAFKNSLQPRTWPKWLLPLVIGVPLAILTLYLLGMSGKVKRIAGDVQRRASAAVAAASK